MLAHFCRRQTEKPSKGQWQQQQQRNQDLQGQETHGLFLIHCNLLSIEELFQGVNALSC